MLVYLTALLPDAMLLRYQNFFDAWHEYARSGATVDVPPEVGVWQELVDRLSALRPYTERGLLCSELRDEEPAEYFGLRTQRS